MPCIPFKTEHGWGIACTRGKRPMPCVHCGRSGGLLCDFPVRRAGKETTCDASLCVRCTSRPSADMDLCRAHAPLWKDGKPTIGSGAVLALLLALALPLHAQEPVKLSMNAGALAVLSSSTTAGATPTLRLGVDAPLDHRNSLMVQADLSGLPGSPVPDTGDVESFKSIEMSVGLSHDFEAFSGSPYIEGGFATRLPGDSAPRVRAARWAAAGVIFQADTAGYLKVGLGVDQRLPGAKRYQAAITLSGSVRLWNAEDKDGKETARLSLVVSSILGIGGSAQSAGDLVRVGVVVGVGR